MTEFDLGNGYKLINVHEPNQCAGEYCVIHNPSPHPYRTLPMTSTMGLIERKLPDGSFVLDPDSAAFIGTNILRNSAYCTACKVDLQSRWRHDFKGCKCGQVFVDGGYDYVRHGVGITYVDTSIYTEL